MADIYPHNRSFFLDIPLRRMIVSPEKQVEFMKLNKKNSVLEIGAGSGYFSLAAARKVKRIEVLDIQKEMLEKIKEKAEKNNITNIRFTLGDAAKLPYPDNSFDVVFMTTVLGEVHSMDSCLKEIHRVLKAKGNFSVVEQKGDPEYIPLKRLAVIAAKYGFALSEKQTRLLSYSANFKAKPL